MRVLTFDQLKKEKGVPYSRTHLRRKIKAKEFPSPISLSDRRIAWSESEIDEWLSARMAKRDQAAASAS